MSEKAMVEAWKEKLAGVTFEGHQKVLKMLDGKTVSVHIVHEKDNEYDDNAHAVHLFDGRGVGYIPAKSAKYIVGNNLKIANGGVGELSVSSFANEKGETIYNGWVSFLVAPSTYNG